MKEDIILALVTKDKAKAKKFIREVKYPNTVVETTEEIGKEK